VQIIDKTINKDKRWIEKIISLRMTLMTKWIIMIKRQIFSRYARNNIGIRDADISLMQKDYRVKMINRDHQSRQDAWMVPKRWDNDESHVKWSELFAYPSSISRAQHSRHSSALYYYRCYYYYSCWHDRQMYPRLEEWLSRLINRPILRSRSLTGARTRNRKYQSCQ